MLFPSHFLHFIVSCNLLEGNTFCLKYLSVCQYSLEFRSFSKNGGFTGVRCAFTILPKELDADTGTGEFQPLHPLWNRRFSTKFNGVGYPVQRAAEALYFPEGKADLIQHYMSNAHILREAVTACGLPVFGGIHAPYLWVRGPEGRSSWELFDPILEEANVVITPGSGFGEAGEGYFRISAFNSRLQCQRSGKTIADDPAGIANARSSIPIAIEDTGK